MDPVCRKLTVRRRRQSDTDPIAFLENVLSRGKEDLVGRQRTEEALSSSPTGVRAILKVFREVTVFQLKPAG